MTIDGLGGHIIQPLTIAISIINLFKPLLVKIDDTPNCGNILSGVGAFSIETGLVKPPNHASIRVYMTNSGNRCLLKFPLENGQPIYHGDTRIDGNVSSHCLPVCLSLCPTGNCDESTNMTVNQRFGLNDIS